MKPKIRFILTRDENLPTGGVKQSYRQVDVLNANGFDAAVVMGRGEGRCTWFENTTRVLDYDDLELQEQISEEREKRINNWISDNKLERINDNQKVVNKSFN